MFCRSVRQQYIGFIKEQLTSLVSFVFVRIVANLGIGARVFVWLVIGRLDPTESDLRLHFEFVSSNVYNLYLVINRTASGSEISIEFKLVCKQHT